MGTGEGVAHRFGAHAASADNICPENVIRIVSPFPAGGPTDVAARMLAEMGIRIVPIEEDEGNVDRYVLSKRLAIERRTGARILSELAEPRRMPVGTEKD